MKLLVMLFGLMFSYYASAYEAIVLPPRRSTVSTYLDLSASTMLVFQ